MKIFFERDGKDNKLLSEVHHDLEVTSFLTACRALGMIDKFITGPLWRAISKDGHILDINVFTKDYATNLCCGGQMHQNS